MGLDYSIRIYIETENISNCLNWLYKKSSGNDFVLVVNNEQLKLKGSGFKLYNSKNYVEKSIVIDKLDSIDFSTSLIFDIDPVIIESIAGSDWKYRLDSLEDFKERLADVNLKEGNIEIGNFDSSISKLKNNEIYEIEFTAVTSDMSRMIEDSISVKKWILEFSKISEAILSYIDMEHNGRKILYYKGHQTNITYNHEIESGSIYSFQNIFIDYFMLEYDLIIDNNECPQKLNPNRINIVEDHFYSVYIKDSKWYIDIESGYNKILELTENQITRFKKEGKLYTDTYVKEWLKKQ